MLTTFFYRNYFARLFNFFSLSFFKTIFFINYCITDVFASSIIFIPDLYRQIKCNLLTLK
jgi:hypothetical protein